MANEIRLNISPAEALLVPSNASSEVQKKIAELEALAAQTDSLREQYQGLAAESYQQQQDVHILQSGQAENEEKAKAVTLDFSNMVAADRELKNLKNQRGFPEKLIDCAQKVYDCASNSCNDCVPFCCVETLLTIGGGVTTGLIFKTSLAIALGGIGGATCGLVGFYGYRKIRQICC